MFKVQIRLVTVLASLVAVLLITSLAQAQTKVEQKSLDRAHAFLAPEQRGKAVCGAVHFGAQYKGHSYREWAALPNPGQFKLVYRYKWENDGITDVAFLCDAKGNVYDVEVRYTNAVLQQPFALANASINIVGNLVLETFRDKMTREEAAQVRRFIDNPNARGLLGMNLKLQQTFGQ